MSPSTNPSFIRLALQNTEAIQDPAVRLELEQLVAAIQQWANKVISVENIPLEDITIDASQIVSGLVATSRGGTGLNGAAATDGQLLIGDTTLTGFALNTLTAGSGITITNGAHTITIAADTSTIGHLHGLDRYTGDGAETVYNLSDIAEYLELVSVNGSMLDPLNVTLSSDGTQITLSSAPSAGQIIVASYVIASIS